MPVSYRTIAIPTRVAQWVRKKRSAPEYGHPAHAEVATGYGPCRHCLQTFTVGEDRRILFTYDPFEDLGPFPLPGPIFIHEEACGRHPEDEGFPDDLMAHPLTLIGYGPDRTVRREIRVEGQDAEAGVQQLLAQSDVDYIHVRDTSAGCYDLRIERQAEPPRTTTEPDPQGEKP